MGPTRKAPWLRLIALVLAGGLDVAAVGYCAHAAGSSLHLEARFVSGEGPACPWRVDLGEGDARGPTTELPCALAVAGVPLSRPSLVRDPGYLESAPEYETHLASQRALWAALAGRADADLRLVAPDGRERTARAAVRRFGVDDVTPTVVVVLLTGLVSALIGVFVFWSRPREPAALALLVATQGMLACFVVTGLHACRGLVLPAPTVAGLLMLNLGGALAGTGGLVYLASVFPEPRFGRWTPLLGGVVPALAATALLVATTMGWFVAAQVGAIAMALVFLALLVAAQVKPRSQVRRLEARWVLWGCAVPLVVWSVARIPTFLGRGASDPSDELLALSGIAIPAGIGIAILRYRLLDIGVVIRRTILGAAVTAAALFAYSLGVSAFAGGLAPGEGGPSSFDAVFITALVLAFLLLPLQSQLERLLDRLFFRRRYNARRVLAAAPDHLAGVQSPEEAADLVLSRVSEAMESPRVVVAVAPSEGEPRCWARVENEEEEAASAALAPPTTGQLWDRARELDEPRLVLPQSESDPIDEWLRDGGLDLVVPLRTERRLVGLLACAAPRGRKLVDADDVAALRTVGAALALALSRTTAEEALRALTDELEERIEQRTSELEKARLESYQWEKMAALGVLAAGVAHELNTPLGVAVSTADQLRDHLADADETSRAARLSRLCAEAAGRAAAIVADLRTVSRPGDEEPGIVDLHDVVDATLRLLAPMLRSRGIEARVERSDIPTVEGFTALLNQTLTNLVINAATAIGQDGEIRISTSHNDGVVTLSVEDSGPGVPEEVRDRIFEPFFTTRSPGEGTGLGLSLCYTFVKEHGGRIREESEPGKGARFVVELPVERPRELRKRPSER